MRNLMTAVALAALMMASPAMAGGRGNYSPAQICANTTLMAGMAGRAVLVCGKSAAPHLRTALSWMKTECKLPTPWAPSSTMLSSMK